MQTLAQPMTIEEIWVEFSTRLHRFILSRVPDEDSAEDILQDVFLKVHTRIETLKDTNRLEAWIYQITRNAITDYYRSRRLTVDVPDSLTGESEIDEIGSDAVEQITPCVREMVKQLPDDYREALELTTYEGITQQELAERKGISISGAKSRVQRARDKIRQAVIACCHPTFDRLGRIIDYQTCNCHADRGCASSCSTC